MRRKWMRKRRMMRGLTRAESSLWQEVQTMEGRGALARRPLVEVVAWVAEGREAVEEEEAEEERALGGFTKSMEERREDRLESSSCSTVSRTFLFPFSFSFASAFFFLAFLTFSFSPARGRWTFAAGGGGEMVARLGEMMKKLPSRMMKKPMMTIPHVDEDDTDDEKTDDDTDGPETMPAHLAGSAVVSSTTCVRCGSSLCARLGSSTLAASPSSSFTSSFSFSSFSSFLSSCLAAGGLLKMRDRRADFLGLLGASWGWR